MNKIALHTLILVFYTQILFASDVNFIHRDFSVRQGKITYKGYSDGLGRTLISPSAETYWSKNQDIGSGDYFFHVHLQKANNKPVRAFEFSGSSSEVRSGTIKFNNQGQAVALTGCDSNSGCITITKGFCDRATDSRLMDSVKMRECTKALEAMLAVGPFGSQAYQDLAASEYKAIENYKRDNKINQSWEYSWASKMQGYFAEDKGKVNTHTLRQNLSKRMGDQRWDYVHAIRGLGRAYQLCEDYGKSLAPESEQNSSGTQAPAKTDKSVR